MDPEYKNTSNEQTVTEEHTKAPEGGVTGAAAGGILGSSLGLLVGMGTLSIPGLGLLIAAGPIMAALSGSAIGGSVGLLLGTLIGAGIPEQEAKKYESGLKQGNILVSIDVDTDEEIDIANEILQQEEPERSFHYLKISQPKITHPCLNGSNLEESSNF